eukprot:scaffold624_cov150-Cylindrotheca_fusiformis.AAC.9
MDIAEEDDAQVSKRQAIQAIMRDSSLTPQERQKKIQEFMAGGAKPSAGDANNSALPPPSNDPPPATSKQVLMKEVMQDKSLTTQEKQKRIQEIMAASKAAQKADTEASKAAEDIPKSSPPAAVGASAVQGTTDPATRKLNRESMRNLDGSQHRQEQASQNSARASAVGAVSMTSPVDASARKQKRESLRNSNHGPGRASKVGASPMTSPVDASARKQMRASEKNSPVGAPPLAEKAPSLDLKSSSSHGSMDDESKPAAETPAPITSNQEKMKAVMQDKSLTPQEKQKRIQEIMAAAKRAPKAETEASKAAEDTPNSPRPAAVGASAVQGTVDPAARKLNRESLRNLDRSQHGQDQASKSPKTPQSTARASVVGASPMTSPVDPSARKQQRESLRNSNHGRGRASKVGASPMTSPVDGSARKQMRASAKDSPVGAPPLNEPTPSPDSKSFSSHGSTDGDESKPTAESPAPTTSKQEMMKAVMQDKSLTPQEKKTRIQQIMAGGVGVGVAAAGQSTDASSGTARGIQQEPIRSLQAASNTGLAAAGAAALAASSVNAATSGSVNAIAASDSMAAAAASPAPASSDPAARKIQRDSARRLQSSSSSAAEEDPAPSTSRQAMMQAVMRDTTLSPQEKQQRIQEIMASSEAASASVAPEEVTPFQHQQQQQQRTLESVPVTEENDELPRSLDAQQPGESDDNFLAEQIEAFVPGQEHGTAVAALDIVTQEELEEEEENRKRRFLWLGVIVFCILIIAIIVTVLTLAPDDEPIGEVVVDSESPTQAPSSAPTPSAVLELLAELEGRYPDSEMYDQAFSDFSTPQYQALLWATGDGNPESLSGTDPRMISRYALATFYFATNGDDWVRCSRDGTSCDPGEEWLLAEDECNWLAITCAANTKEVTRIFFEPTGSVNGNNVGGTMPFEVSLLSSLTRITISGNTIGGSIPDSWSSLTTLEAIVLGNNMLTGSLPSSLISNNPNLVQIRLNDNQLSQLPESPTSDALTLLNLQNNNLMGPIPEGLSVRLELSDNALSGTISDALCSLKTTGGLNFLTVDCDEVTCGCCDNCT